MGGGPPIYIYISIFKFSQDASVPAAVRAPLGRQVPPARPGAPALPSAPGLLGLWTPGFQGSWAPVLLNSWAPGPPDSWFPKLLVPGLLNSWVPGPPDSWAPGLPKLLGPQRSLIPGLLGPCAPSCNVLSKASGKFSYAPSCNILHVDGYRRVHASMDK